MTDDVDSLREDMALHQRRFSGEVTDSKNHALAAGVFERLDRRQAEDGPGSPTPVEMPASKPVGVTTQRKEGKHGNYLLSTAPTDNSKFRIGTPAEHWFMTHAMSRVTLLMSKVETGPLGQASWAQRTYAVMELQSRVAGLRARGLHASADDVTKRFMFELIELLEASSAPFGDWKADAVKNPRIGWTSTKG
jgi:hypothetical protein